MTKYTEDNLKYIQEKIEQGFELSASDEYSDTFELSNPKKDYIKEIKYYVDDEEVTQYIYTIYGPHKE